MKTKTMVKAGQYNYNWVDGWIWPVGASQWTRFTGWTAPLMPGGTLAAPGAPSR